MELKKKREIISASGRLFGLTIYKTDLMSKYMEWVSDSLDIDIIDHGNLLFETEGLDPRSDEMDGFFDLVIEYSRRKGQWHFKASYSYSTNPNPTGRSIDVSIVETYVDVDATFNEVYQTFNRFIEFVPHRYRDGETVDGFWVHHTR